MNNIWRTLSHLGLDSSANTLENKSIILTNQLNVITLIVFIIMVITTRLVGYIENTSAGMGTYRSLFMIIMSSIVVILSFYKHHKISRFILIFVSPFLLIILPTLCGFIEEESFIYYPYVLIAMSFFPQLLIIPQKEKTLYFISIAYYFIAILGIDVLLMKASSEYFEITSIISPFYLWYKIIPIAIFVFTFYSIYYLRSINYQFDKIIKRNNKKLDLQNETLKTTIHELNKTQAKLIHAEKMAALGNLTSGIAHEINNPLNHIAAGSFFITEALEEAKEKDEERIEKKAIEKAHEIIESGINRAARVVQLLSVFSKNDNCIKDAYNLSQIIEGTLCFINVKIEGVITIEKQYKYDGNVFVFQDQIHKVLLSVLENSVESIVDSGNKGLIRISTQQVDNEVSIKIYNSGSNIPVKNLLRVFNPFFTTKSHKMNSGLGLTVAYNSIHEHGGDITITNENEGVLVEIKIPI